MMQVFFKTSHMGNSVMVPFGVHPYQPTLDFTFFNRRLTKGVVATPLTVFPRSL